jgi:hypothetical protein
MISKDIVLLLFRKSAEHYDMTCRDASKKGGFIYGWVNRLNEPNATFPASFRQLDLTLKICEVSNNQGNYTDFDKNRTVEYSSFVIRLLKESNAFIMSIPKKTIN